MRRIDGLAGIGVLFAAGVAGAYAAGCGLLSSGETDCSVYPCQTSTSSSSGASPSCTPSQNSMPVDDMCGVFVSPNGSDSNAGTKEKPLKTLAAAAAKGKPVYACAGTAPFTEAFAPAKPVDLFGALDCTSWKYTPMTKTALTAAADAVPLTLAIGATGSAIHDFAITAADASKVGGSSIAVLDDQAALTLDKVDISAGAGKDGTAGAAQSQVMTPASAKGSSGTDDATCNTASIIPGGAGGTNTCGGTSTNGGNGGKGVPSATGDSGLGGQPTMTPSNGGAGQTAAPCQPGTSGNAATAGAAAAGTPGTGARGIGDVSTNGYQPPNATLGGSGTSGQGGGGGGAAHACDASNMFSGPSGGGGGAGGCGGAPGNPGTSGGSSIGILALNAKLTLSNVTIATKGGGAGGLGGDGQVGGSGGQPGGAAGAACAGGKGGQGGNGGPGGGGAGGHSVGIAIKGGSLPSLGSTTITPGSAGAGGKGGDMDMTAQTKGDDGKACKTLDFTNPASMTACGM